MRGPCVDKNGFKKGAWSEEEDDKLRAYILRYGHWNWRLLPQFAGLARCGKSCRLRWLNYLKPGVRRGNYTKEEEDLIAKLHDEFGNKWSAIAAKLPGRTDNDIKNYWHTNMKKRTMRNIIAENNSMHKSSCKSKDSSSEALKRLTKLKKDLEPLDVHILESSGSNSENNPGLVNCDSEDSASSLRLLSEEIVLAETYSRRVLELFQDNSSYSSFAGFEESFWSEPFMVDSSTCYSQDHSFSVPNLDEGDDGIFSGYLFS